MALDDTGYDLTAQLLGLSQHDDPQAFNNYWLHMDGTRRVLKPLSLTVPAVFVNRNLLTVCCVATVSTRRIFFNEYPAALGL